MTDEKKKIVKYVSIGCIAIGSVGLYIAGASESTGTAVVAGVFAFVAIIVNAIKD